MIYLSLSRIEQMLGLPFPIPMVTVLECKKFAKETLKYLKSFWMKLDPNTWNMFSTKDRTNNRAEGYNNALGAKRSISKHPNAYSLVSVIKDELSSAMDQALTIIMCVKEKKCQESIKSCEKDEIN